MCAFSRPGFWWLRNSWKLGTGFDGFQSARSCAGPAKNRGRRVETANSPFRLQRFRATMIVTLKANIPSICRAFAVRCAIAFLPLCGDLVGLEPDHDISQYGDPAWTRPHGGPESGVFPLSHTPHGSL